VKIGKHIVLFGAKWLPYKSPDTDLPGCYVKYFKLWRFAIRYVSQVQGGKGYYDIISDSVRDDIPRTIAHRIDVYWLQKSYPALGINSQMFFDLARRKLV
jgi:hypothetical protein